MTQTTRLRTAPDRQRRAATEMVELPAAICEFVRQQHTAPIASVVAQYEKEATSIYSRHWFRAVLAVLLSGRVSPKTDGGPNMTDVNRLCKEANFNQYLLRDVAEFLVRAEAVKVDRGTGQFVAGPYCEAFAKHDVSGLRQATARALLEFVQQFTGFQVWRPTFAMHSRLVEFVALFGACFGVRWLDTALARGTVRQDQIQSGVKPPHSRIHGGVKPPHSKGRARNVPATLRQHLAVPVAKIGAVWSGLSELPAGALAQAAERCGIQVKASEATSWHHWLDEKGQAALRDALYATFWAYCDEHEGQQWFYLSRDAPGMLGLADVLLAAPLSADLKALPNRSVFAGAGLELDKLAALFRLCKIKRIDQLIEFQVDARRLAEAPSSTSPGEELRSVLKSAEPLPSTIADLVGVKSQFGGELGIAFCRALVKPADPEAIEAIRRHPRLKGYLAPHAPPGYLVIKSNSDPDGLVRRCRELGFEVKAL